MRLIDLVQLPEKRESNEDMVGFNAMLKLVEKALDVEIVFDEEKLLELFKDKYLRKITDTEYGTMIWTRHLYSLSPSSFMNLIASQINSILVRKSNEPNPDENKPKPWRCVRCGQISPEGKYICDCWNSIIEIKE